MGWPGEAVHKYADALEYAFLLPACCLLLLLELLIQFLILLLHVRPETVLRCSVKRHGDNAVPGQASLGIRQHVTAPFGTGQMTQKFAMTVIDHPSIERSFCTSASILSPVLVSLCFALTPTGLSFMSVLAAVRAGTKLWPAMTKYTLQKSARWPLVGPKRCYSANLSTKHRQERKGESLSPTRW